jgi:hypothetical protein
MTERTNHLTAIKRSYIGIQDNPPNGPWSMRVEEDDVTLADTCDDDHKAGAREEMDRRMDARIAMEID